jgi:hypothetical protein
MQLSRSKVFEERASLVRTERPEHRFDREADGHEVRIRRPRLRSTRTFHVLLRFVTSSVTSAG